VPSTACALACGNRRRHRRSRLEDLHHPGPGEPGNDTWAGESWKYGGGSTWITGAYDKETNTLYCRFGNPGPDFDRHVRLGDNLFTNSNLVLDPDTGKIRSYFNYTPNDPYDYDGVNEDDPGDVAAKSCGSMARATATCTVSTASTRRRARPATSTSAYGDSTAARELDQADHPSQQLQADLQLS